MKTLVKTSLALSALSFCVLSPAAFADRDDVARGGLAAFISQVTAALANINSAIDQNSADIQTNTSAINQNSAAISDNAAAIAALQSQGTTSYDYHDYQRAPNILSKTFNIRNIANCDTEVRFFNSVTTGDVTDTTLTRVRTAAGAPCRYHTFSFRGTPDGVFRTGTSSYSSDGSVLNTTVTLDKPVILRSSNMQLGIDLGDATTTTVQPSAGPSFPGYFISKTVLVGIESVTVPYNGGTTFDGCLRLHITHESTAGFGGGPQDRYEWHCPGVGMVKRIQGTGQYYELADIAYGP